VLGGLALEALGDEGAQALGAAEVLGEPLEEAADLGYSRESRMSASPAAPQRSMGTMGP